MNRIKKYAGNPYTSYNTISMVAVDLFLCLFFLFNAKFNLHILYVIPALIAFAFLFWMNEMNYFIIENGDLIIKSHYLPWKKKIISLVTITEFETVKMYKHSRALRIVTNDKRIRHFFAGSLRKQDWRHLVADLKKLGIQKRKFSELI